MNDPSQSIFVQVCKALALDPHTAFNDEIFNVIRELQKDAHDAARLADELEELRRQRAADRQHYAETFNGAIRITSATVEQAAGAMKHYGSLTGYIYSDNEWREEARSLLEELRRTGAAEVETPIEVLVNGEPQVLTPAQIEQINKVLGSSRLPDYHPRPL